jgi:hypothetical protein
MKTIKILIALIALSASVNITTAQHKSINKAVAIENNYIYEITHGFESTRSANIMSALQFYITNPDTNKMPIIDTLIKVIRCDSVAENRYAALLAVTVLNDESLRATFNDQKSTDLVQFTNRIYNEVGLHYVATSQKLQ